MFSLSEIAGNVCCNGAKNELRENRHLVTTEPVEFEKFLAEVETAGNPPVKLEELEMGTCFTGICKVPAPCAFNGFHHQNQSES